MSYPREIPGELINYHWQMIDSLFSEFMLYKRDELAHKGTYLLYLMQDASRDPRFEAVGLGRHAEKFYIVYVSPQGFQYQAEAAMAAFLGLDMVGEKSARTTRGEWMTQCTRVAQSATRILGREWPNSTEFQWWLRWRAQQARGYTNKTLHFNTGYEVNRVRDFPETLKLINELYPQKD